MKHEISHDLDLENAKSAARKAVESYEQRFSQYRFQSNWTRDDRAELAFDVMGKRLQGSLEVKTDRLIFELDVPLMFRVFSKQATDIIEREAKAWIEKVKQVGPA